LTDENEMMSVDCRKTRAAQLEWKRASGKLWKSFGIPTNQRQRITGTVKGSDCDFATVKRGAVKKFAAICGRPWEDFEADPVEFERWKSERRSRVKPGSDSLFESSVPNTPSLLDDHIRPLHRRLCGYYELYHHATSKHWTPAISISLLHVGDIDPNRGVLRCELHDTNRARPYYHLRGHVAPIGGFLYWELRHDTQDAVCHCYCYRPVGGKYPGFTLYGIFLTISGDEKLDYPIAARGAMRFLGETATEAMQNSVVDLRTAEGEPEKVLQSNVGGYLEDLEKNELLRSDVLETIKAKILPNIDNQVSADAAPFALVVPR
jgi:hypothetical protein